MVFDFAACVETSSPPIDHHVSIEKSTWEKIETETKDETNRLLLVVSVHEKNIGNNLQEGCNRVI